MNESTDFEVVATKYFFNSEEILIADDREKKSRIMKLLVSMPLQNTL